MKMKFFETIKIENNIFYNLDYHQERFEKTYFENFGQVSNLKIVEFLKPFHKCTRAKFVYGFDFFEMSYFDYYPKKIEKIKLVEINDFDYTYKLFDRVFFDDLLNQNRNIDEIFMFKNGLLTDCTIANIVILEDNNWISPKKPLLFGTTLKRFGDLGTVLFDDIDYNRLIKAQKIGFLNAMIGFKIFDKLEFV